jgi:DNA-binding protein H-NS
MHITTHSILEPIDVKGENKTWTGCGRRGTELDKYAATSHASLAFTKSTAAK